jgi:chorismate mutase-like protein
MSEPQPSFADLRREIDAIDDQVHDLLMLRAAVVARIAPLKDDGPAIRPAREAELLRRLAARHAGPLPVASVVRIWRELIAALTAMQGAFSVAVHVAPKHEGLWDLARDHYGSHTPMSAHEDPVGVIRAVRDFKATVGVLPPPDDEDVKPWWPHLLAGGPGIPKTIARLPFAGVGNSRDVARGAFAVAQYDVEPTGDDRSLMAICASEPLSRTSILTAVTGVGLEAVIVTAQTGGDECRYLLDADDYLGQGDARLAQLQAALGASATRVAWLGSYARPLVAANGA